MVEESLYRVPNIWVYRCMGWATIAASALCVYDAYSWWPQAAIVFGVAGVVQVVFLGLLEVTHLTLRRLRREILESEDNDDF